MNVLLMVSWYGPQGEKLTGGNFHYDLAQGLSKWCNCAIYYPYDRHIEETFTDNIEWGIRTFRSKYALEKKFRNRLYMYQAMKKIIKEFKPDIIHGQVATEAGRFAVMLGEIFHIPVIISEHSAVEASGVTSFPHYHYAKRVYRKSLYNTCVSDSLTENLKSIFPKYEFHTVYNGIKKLNIENGNKDYRRDDCVNMIMIAGLYDRYIKGLQYVLPAVKKLQEEGYKVCFHHVGNGEYLDEYIDKAKQLGIDNNCIFYGFCEKEKVYSILSEMDFFVCASIFESFSCTTAEAMMLGKPVVATRCGGPDSIVTDKTGILVEKESEQAIYEGLKQMIQTFSCYSEKYISEYAYNKFSVENISEQYIKIYEKIINKTGKR